jgi:hypothetical protein
MAQAQTIKYDFEFATNVLTAGLSGPRITASVGLTSSTYNNWYTQNRTPVYPNNTKTLSVVNIEGSYANGTSRRSLLLQAQQVTNASGGNSTTLFQQEFPGYAAGDGVFHRYSIEIDLLSNRTIWIVDDTIISMFKLSFVPANIVLIVSATDPGDLAEATLRGSVQTALLPLVPVTSIFIAHSFTSHILNFIRRAGPDHQLHDPTGADLFSSKSDRSSERASRQSHHSERPAPGQELAVVLTMVAVDSMGTARGGCWRFPLRVECETENWTERRRY